jgi:hypothetical protein
LIMSILEAERDRRGGVQVTKWQWLDTRNFNQFSYLNSFLLCSHILTFCFIYCKQKVWISYLCQEKKLILIHLQNEGGIGFPLLWKSLHDVMQPKKWREQDPT